MKPVILTVSPLLAFIGCPFGTLTALAPDDDDEPAAWLFALLGLLAPQAAMTATAINVIAATAVPSPQCRLVIEAMGACHAHMEAQRGARVVRADPEICFQGPPHMSSSRGAGGADDHLCAMSPCEITGRQEVAVR